MKFFITSLVSSLFLILTSCNSDRTDEVTTEINISGNWKVDHYEVKGKNYPASACDVNDKINVNVDKTGSYIDSETNTTTNGCYDLVNLAGNWMLNSSNSVLELKYIENNVTMTKSFQLDAISNNEMRIMNPSKVIPGVPSTGEVVEVWIKL
ncbi:lipocalin family protein [Kaistella carnis]|uniref:lipocalin family protein n=1 Tax=Kaistella carnis TaxID=1241979 RepID=UPI0028A969D8|nr:lipocalin family protein [Kaistella carnis]